MKIKINVNGTFKNEPILNNFKKLQWVKTGLHTTEIQSIVLFLIQCSVFNLFKR